MVWVDADGRLLVGWEADRRYPEALERFERSPKLRLGDAKPLQLGGPEVRAEDAVARILAHVLARARTSHGGEPDAVCLTHPARWGAPQTDALRRAAAAAGMPDARLMSECAAAAAFLVPRLTRTEHVAVFDLGGRALDIAVLRRTDDGAFELAGAPAGRPDFGAETLDARLLRHVRDAVTDGSSDAWSAIASSPQAFADLRRDVRRAKEDLSVEGGVEIAVGPSDSGSIRVTRREWDGMIRGDVRDAVDALEETLAAAAVRPEALAAVLMVGGGSRIPLVQNTVAERLGRLPVTREDPKSPVALGATTLLTLDPPPPRAREPRAGGGLYDTLLAERGLSGSRPAHTPAAAPSQGPRTPPATTVRERILARGVRAAVCRQGRAWIVVDSGQGMALSVQDVASGREEARVALPGTARSAVDLRISATAIAVATDEELRVFTHDLHVELITARFFRLGAFVLGPTAVWVRERSGPAAERTKVFGFPHVVLPTRLHRFDLGGGAHDHDDVGDEVWWPEDVRAPFATVLDTMGDDAVAVVSRAEVGALGVTRTRYAEMLSLSASGSFYLPASGKRFDEGDGYPTQAERGAGVVFLTMRGHADGRQDGLWVYRDTDADPAQAELLAPFDSGSMVGEWMVAGPHGTFGLVCSLQETVVYRHTGRGRPWLPMQEILRTPQVPDVLVGEHVRSGGLASTEQEPLRARWSYDESSVSLPLVNGWGPEAVGGGVARLTRAGVEFVPVPADCVPVWADAHTVVVLRGDPLDLVALPRPTAGDVKGR